MALRESVSQCVVGHGHGLCGVTVTVGITWTDEYLILLAILPSRMRGEVLEACRSSV